MATPRSRTWRQYDKHFDGRGAERITELRATGMSWGEMAQVLYGDDGFLVSHETLRQWAITLDIDTEPVAS